MSTITQTEYIQGLGKALADSLATQKELIVSMQIFNRRLKNVTDLATALAQIDPIAGQAALLKFQMDCEATAQFMKEKGV